MTAIWLIAACVFPYLFGMLPATLLQTLMLSYVAALFSFPIGIAELRSGRFVLRTTVITAMASPTIAVLAFCNPYPLYLIATWSGPSYGWVFPKLWEGSLIAAVLHLVAFGMLAMLCMPVIILAIAGNANSFEDRIRCEQGLILGFVRELGRRTRSRASSSPPRRAKQANPL